MTQIITVDFPARKVTNWGLDGFAEAARRCNAEALQQPAEIAAVLKSVAAKYAVRAAEGAG